MIKVILFMALVFLNFSNCHSQGIKLHADSAKFSISSDSAFEVKIIVHNNTDSIIKIPQFPLIYDKYGMSKYELGIEIYSTDMHRKIYCRPAYNFLVDTKMELLRPRETSVIVSHLPKAYFYRKGEYKVTYYLMDIFSISKDTNHRFFSSNEVRIKIY